MKTQTRPVSRVHCPIEPEILLADIQGELQIDEARDIHLHMRECAICQARAEQLRSAYDQVASLADVEEVPVADVRDAVLRDSQGRLRAVRMTRGLNLSVRTLVFGVIAMVALVLVVIAAIAQPLLTSHFLSSPRSRNSLTKVASIGSGLYYAETVKLIPLQSGGKTWYMGEMVALDEHTGHVVRSLPASKDSPFVPSLGIGVGTNIQPLLTNDSKTLVAAAIPSDGNVATAFAAVDALTGNVRYLTRLPLPAGADAKQADPAVRRMWLSANGETLYILTDILVKGKHTTRIMTFETATGHYRGVVIPLVTDTSAANSIAGMLGAVAPDGSFFYDVTRTTQDGKAGINLAFVNLASGVTDARLFIPGNFDYLALSVAPDNSNIYLFNGNEAQLLFISPGSRTVTATLTLLNRASSPPPTQLDALSTSTDATMALTPDGKQAAIMLNKTAGSDHFYDFWVVDLKQQAFISFTQLNQALGTVDISSDGSSILFMRRDGIMQTTSLTRPDVPANWAVLSDNTPIIQMIGARQIATGK